MKRHTNQRRAIHAVLDAAERPLSVDEVLKRGKQLVPSLNRATVYRNLHVMVTAGWVRRLAHPEQGTLYETAARGHHHHFHCRACDRVFELPGCALDVRRSTPAGFRTDAHEVFLYGVCPTCQGKQ